MGSLVKKFVCWLLAVSIAVSPEFGYTQNVGLPAIGQPVALSTNFKPMLLRGVTIDPQEPFRFEFILDKGSTAGKTLDVGRETFPRETSDGSPLTSHPEALKEQSTRLIKYFLAALTVPEKDLWVNLSPYENDRIVDDSLAKTAMGEDLLSEDYILKQLTAGLMNPNTELGRKFWDKVYAQAQAKYGTTDVPVDTFNKVWIVPQSAKVVQKSQRSAVSGQQPGISAYVVETKLKVMLESDYIASQVVGGRSQVVGKNPMASEISKQVLREVIIPVLEKEVNEGESFAVLRQISYALVLAKWYKENLKNTIVARAYADQKKVSGIDDVPAGSREEIYAQYLEAYKEGAHNFIQEEADPATGEIVPRKYFSGGYTAANLAMTTYDLSKPLPSEVQTHLDSAMSQGKFYSALVNLMRPKSIATVDETEWNHISDAARSIIKDKDLLKTLNQLTYDYFLHLDIEGSKDGIFSFAGTVMRRVRDRRASKDVLNEINELLKPYPGIQFITADNTKYQYLYGWIVPTGGALMSALQNPQSELGSKLNTLFALAKKIPQSIADGTEPSRETAQRALMLLMNGFEGLIKWSSESAERITWLNSWLEDLVVAAGRSQQDVKYISSINYYAQLYLQSEGATFAQLDKWKAHFTDKRDLLLVVMRQEYFANDLRDAMTNLDVSRDMLIRIVKYLDYRRAGTDETNLPPELAKSVNDFFRRYPWVNITQDWKLSLGRLLSGKFLMQFTKVVGDRVNMRPLPGAKHRFDPLPASILEEVTGDLKSLEKLLRNRLSNLGPDSRERDDPAIHKYLMGLQRKYFELEDINEKGQRVVVSFAQLKYLDGIVEIKEAYSMELVRPAQTDAPQKPFSDGTHGAVAINKLLRPNDYPGAHEDLAQTVNSLDDMYYLAKAYFDDARQDEARDEQIPFGPSFMRAATAFLNPEEFNFLFALNQALYGDSRVQPRVFIYVQEGSGQTWSQPSRNGRIIYMSRLDFNRIFAAENKVEALRTVLDGIKHEPEINGLWDDDYAPKFNERYAASVKSNEEMWPEIREFIAGLNEFTAPEFEAEFKAWQDLFARHNVPFEIARTFFVTAAKLSTVQIYPLVLLRKFLEFHLESGGVDGRLRSIMWRMTLFVLLCPNTELMIGDFTRIFDNAIDNQAFLNTLVTHMQAPNSSSLSLKLARRVLNMRGGDPRAFLIMGDQTPNYRRLLDEYLRAYQHLAGGGADFTSTGTRQDFFRGLLYAATLPEDEITSNRDDFAQTTDLTPGGIDLRGSFDMEVKRDELGVPLSLEEQPAEIQNITGFTPELLRISPINLSTVLGK